jgi:hypothetical protein
MNFELVCKNITFSSVLASSLISLPVSSNDFYSNKFDGCYDGMSQFECYDITEKNKNRALRYFRTFVGYKSAEYILDQTGYLPVAKDLIHFINDFRTIDTSYGVYYYSGDGLQIKDFMGVKDSYLEFKLGFDSSFDVERVKLQYSVRF